MGTVRGNMGTVLEHVVLSVVVDFVAQQGDGPLRYVDTHAMAPLNRPVEQGFNLLDRLRGSDEAKTTTVPGADTYAEVFAPTWRRGHEEWYPTHFVHAARVASRRSCPMTAWLFEMNAADALPRGHAHEDRRAEIAAFLAAPQDQLRRREVQGVPCAFARRLPRRELLAGPGGLAWTRPRHRERPARVSAGMLPRGLATRRRRLHADQRAAQRVLLGPARSPSARDLPVGEPRNLEW
jgi:hypothetical protein